MFKMPIILRHTVGADEKDRKYLQRFATDSDARLARFFGLSLTFCLVFGAYLNTIEPIINVVLWNHSTEPGVGPVVRPDIKGIEDAYNKKKLPPVSKHPSPPKQRKGAGNPVGTAGRGLLAIITSVSTSSSEKAYTLMEETFASVSDVINNIKGLKESGKTEKGVRQGRTSAGFNEGYVDGVDNGIDDLIPDFLTEGVGGRIPHRDVSTMVRAPDATEIGLPDGGIRRSAASILMVIRSHMPGLRHVYNTFLRKHPGFGGKIHFQFEIAPSGQVVSLNIVNSTTKAADFDAAVRLKVLLWKFEPISGKGNDRVTIPFTFSE